MSDTLFEQTGAYVQSLLRGRDEGERLDQMTQEVIAQTGWWQEIKRRHDLYRSGGGDPEWREKVRKRWAGEEE